MVPEFSDGFPDNVTVQRENAAFLDCPVKNPGDRPVSYPLVSESLLKKQYNFIIILYFCRFPGSESETGIFSQMALSGSPLMIGSMFYTRRGPSIGFYRY